MVTTTTEDHNNTEQLFSMLQQMQSSIIEYIITSHTTTTALCVLVHLHHQANSIYIENKDFYKTTKLKIFVFVTLRFEPATF